MPICQWGGSFCNAGPGAAGSAETVDEHERLYHGKRQIATGAKGQFRAPIIKNVPLDEVDEYLRRISERPSTQSPQATARRSERQRLLAEERRKRGY